MATTLMLLPIYLFGNLHCFGMCGPLVMLLGAHRSRYAYFFGRTLSFTLVGGLAGSLGSVLQVFLHQYHLSALISVVFGFLILTLGLGSIFSWRLPMPKGVNRIQKYLSLWLLKDDHWPIFLFGFFTVFLPCGQTVIVFSACALSASASVGLLNGFLFAILTSPSLFFAMHAHALIKRFKNHYNTAMGTCALLIGTLALCRGLADLGFISHLILNPSFSPQYHLVLF